MPKNHYYAYKSFIREKASYCLLPLCGDAVYADGVYYPDGKFLLLLSKAVKERFQMVPKINEYGEVMTEKGNSKREKQDRIRIDCNYEHYIHSSVDIEWFANEYISNASEFLAFLEQEREKVKEPVTETEPQRSSEPVI